MLDEYTIKVEQTQHEGIGASLHTGKISFRDKELNYIYDCGWNKNTEKAFKKAISNMHRIDIIFISHFCKDHISGLQKLLKKYKEDKTKNTKVLLPYIYDIDKVLPLFFIDNLTDDYILEYFDFIKSRVVWVHKGSDGNVQNPYLDIAYPEYIDNINIVDKDLWKFCYLGNIPLNWCFYPHVYKRDEIADKIIAKINEDAECREFLQKYIDNPNAEYSNELINALHHLLNSLEKDKEFKKLFKVKKGDKRISNLLSMSLYSGPYINSDEDTFHNYIDKCIKEKIRFPYFSIFPMFELEFLDYYFESYRVNFMQVGWLHTGDANLLDEQRREDFNLHYKKYKRNIAVMSLPHHGSKNNFHPDILPDNTAITNISPFKIVCKNTLVDIEQLKEQTQIIPNCTKEKSLTFSCIGNIRFVSQNNAINKIDCTYCENCKKISE